MLAVRAVTHLEHTVPHRGTYAGTVLGVAQRHGPGGPIETSKPADPRPTTISRRRFLNRSLGTGSGLLFGSGLAKLAVPTVGGAASLLAACGSDPVPPTIVTLFSPDRVLAAGREQRIPFAIVTPPAGSADEVALPADDGLVAVTVELEGAVILETEVRGRVVEHDHVGETDPDHQHANLFRYYALRAELPEPGIYDLTIVVEGVESMLPIQLFDPSEVKVPLSGDPFTAPATPTFDDAAGVDPICTRFEPCPFHDISADAAQAEGRPLALLVATPAFCSTAYCGPVLETLIAQSESTPDVTFIHAEVYANPSEVDGNFLDPAIRVAPAVAEVGLEFEPSLFLVSAEGTLVDRIDNVFDATELAEAMALLTP